MYKPSTYLVVTYYSTYEPTYETYFLKLVTEGETKYYLG